MKTHIKNISRKQMATGSGWGRLMAVAFLCIFSAVSFFVQNVSAGPITLSVPDGINSVSVKKVSDSNTIFSYPPTPNQNVAEDVFLQAIATPGWVFSHWTGWPIDGTNSNPSNTIPFSPAPVSVTANFVKTTYTLTHAVSGSGTVSPPSGTSYEFDDNLQVSATALPGYEFTGWSGSVREIWRTPRWPPRE